MHCTSATRSRAHPNPNRCRRCGGTASCWPRTREARALRCSGLEASRRRRCRPGPTGASRPRSGRGGRRCPTPAPSTTQTR
eukprot:scaffold12750_cov34-Phaeocystis_antarctica.AAC.2